MGKKVQNGDKDPKMVPKHANAARKWQNLGRKPEIRVGKRDFGGKSFGGGKKSDLKPAFN